MSIIENPHNLKFGMLIFNFVQGQTHLYTNKRESFLTSLPNSSQESAPIGTYDTLFDSYCHRDGPRGVRFPEFFAVLGKNPGNDWVVL